jgi:hypothetical protein
MSTLSRSLFPITPAFSSTASRFGKLTQRTKAAMIPAKQSVLKQYDNRTVTESSVSHFRGALQGRHTIPVTAIPERSIAQVTAVVVPAKHPSNRPLATFQPGRRSRHGRNRAR